MAAGPLACPHDWHVARAGAVGVGPARAAADVSAKATKRASCTLPSKSWPTACWPSPANRCTQFLAPPGQIVQVRAGTSKQAVLRLAERNHSPAMPVADAAGRLIGYVRVVDLCLHAGDDLAPMRPLPEFPEETTHLAALMRLESSGDSLARVVNARGETVGIVTLERLREPLF